jgi:TRAP-type C4-dicarboxylate transport system permease small subunit
MMIAKIVSLINNLLTFNFFFVLLSFAWFMIAIIGKYTNLPLGMQVWQSLWEPLFLPAISVLMGGAILSGTVSYLTKDPDRSSF